MPEFGELLETIRDQLQQAHIHWGIFTAIAPSPESDTEILQRIRGEHHGFWEWTIVAHRDRFFIKMDNVARPNGRYALHKALRMVDDCPDLARDANLGALRTRLDAQADLLNRMQTFRDKRVAHHDIRASIPQVFRDESRDLLEELEGVFNVLYGHHCDTTVSFSHFSHIHAQLLLRRLEDAYQ